MLTEIVRFAVISYKFYQLFPSIPFFFYYSFRPSRRWKIPTDFQTWIAKMYGKLNAVSARNTFVKTSINYRKIRAYFLEFFSSYIKKKKRRKEKTGEEIEEKSMASNIVSNRTSFVQDRKEWNWKLIRKEQRVSSPYWNEVKQFRWFKDAEISE